MNEKQIYFVKASKPDHHNENVCVSKVKCKKTAQCLCFKKGREGLWVILINMAPTVTEIAEFTMSLIKSEVK